MASPQGMGQQQRDPWLAEHALGSSHYQIRRCEIAPAGREQSPSCLGLADDVHLVGRATSRMLVRVVDTDVGLRPSVLPHAPAEQDPRCGPQLRRVDIDGLSLRGQVQQRAVVVVRASSTSCAVRSSCPGPRRWRTQPLTAPERKPWVTCFCISRNSTTTGRIVISVPAANGPMSMERPPRNRYKPVVSGRYSPVGR